MPYRYKRKSNIHYIKYIYTDSANPTSILLKDKSYCENNEMVAIIILFDAHTENVTGIMIMIEYSTYVPLNTF